MSTIPLLPSMKDSCQIATGQPGEWRADSQTSLGSLVESLNVTAKEESNISSIPDIWARPAAFEMILFDKDHQMHQRFLNEWRGILAILALREIRGINKLKVHSISIPYPENLKSTDSSLLKLFSRMLPETLKRYPDESVSDGVKLQVFSYNDNPLAIIWPSLLICPAVELRCPYNANISWWTDDGITDPLIQNSLNNDEKIILHHWLDKVHEDITSKDIPDNSPEGQNIGKLAKLLTEYKRELNITADLPNLSFSSEKDLDISGFCSRLGKADVLEMSGEDFLRVSSVLLANNTGSNAKNILVLTDDLPDQRKKAPSDITVAGSYSYETVWPKITKSPNRHKIANIDLSNYNAEIWLPDDFFTEKICVIAESENCFPDARVNILETYKGNNVNILIPLQEKVLQYLRPDYIARNIHFKTYDYQQEHCIEVELTVPTSGDPITLKKTYKESNESKEDRTVIRLSSLPILQVWPNFQISKDDGVNWNHYYAFYDNQSYPTFNAIPYWPKNETFHRTLETHRKTELWKGPSYPTAFICSIDDNDAQEDRTIPIGLILPNPPRELIFSNSMKKATIGIDFGTTNTVAYISVDNVPKIITFNNYLPNAPEKSLINNVTLLDDSKKDFWETYTRQNFLAMSEQPAAPATSIRTIFHHHIGAMDMDTVSTLPFFPGNIYYQDKNDSIGEDMDLIKTLQTDEMKWDLMDAAGKENRHNFLLQLGMQCMAEALAQEVTHIEWYYSYPTSFTIAQQTSLEETWQHLIKQFKLIYPNVGDSVKSNSESIAMARYFTDEAIADAGIRNGIVCFDIGGGSTDIAVWQGSKSNTDKAIRAQCSLRFAGKNILNDQLFKHSDFLSDFIENGKPAMNDELKQIQNAAQKGDRKTFNILLEAFLKYYEEPIFARLSAVKTSTKTKTLIRNLTFSLSGIFFYTGIIVGDLRVTGNYGEYRELPECYVGGNGSKLLNWAAGGHFSDANQVALIFKHVFKNGVDKGHDFRNRVKNNIPIAEKSKGGYKPFLSIHSTKHPKQEVAYGLVSPKVIQATDEEEEMALSGSFEEAMSVPESTPFSTQNSFLEGSNWNDQGTKVIAGEYFMMGDQEKSGLSTITANDLANNDLEVHEDLILFRAFLDCFNEASKGLKLPTITLTDNDFRTIWRKVNQQLADTACDENNIMVEPFFIMVLKEALKLI